MELMRYVDNLRQELTTAAEAGDPQTREVAERLVAPLSSAIRLVLLDALSTAADEITRELAPGSVQVHLRGRDPEFVVTPQPVEPPTERAPAGGAAPVDDAGLDDGPAVRVNLRLPEQLKAAFEEAAGKEGRSLNAWLVRAGSTALRASERDHGPDRRGARSAQRYTGWAR